MLASAPAPPTNAKAQIGIDNKEVKKALRPGQTALLKTKKVLILLVVIIFFMFLAVDVRNAEVAEQR